MGQNMKFKFQGLYMKFCWNTPMLIHVCVSKLRQILLGLQNIKDLTPLLFIQKAD